jgi:hypothetical protein
MRKTSATGLAVIIFHFPFAGHFVLTKSILCDNNVIITIEARDQEYQESGMAITGTHLVRALRSALQSAKHFWPKVGDRMEIRRNALKLRFWGMRSESDSNDAVMDVSYESIKTLQGLGVYELRLEDAIGGHRNIRVVFFVPPEKWKPKAKMPLPTIWILEALPKKRQEWTAHDINRFRAKRKIVKERFFDD